MEQIKRYQRSLFLLFFIGCIALGTACSRKTGCPGEDAQVKVDKKGNPKSKPKSGLFDKKMTKKMKHE
jgi:hypothetical protein